MIERAGIRFNIGDYVNVEIDTEGPTCICTGTIDGEPVDFGGGGGASNIVNGSFTLLDNSTPQDILLPYEGAGFPIAVLICLDSLITDDIVSDSSLEKAVVAGAFIKRNTEEPDYITQSAADFSNKGFYSLMLKTSTSFNYSGGANIFYYDENGAESLSGSNTSAFKIKNNKTLSISPFSTGKYGFLPIKKYNYFAVYSE